MPQYRQTTNPNLVPGAETVEQRLESFPSLIAYGDAGATILTVSDATGSGAAAVSAIARKTGGSAYGVLGNAMGNDGVQGRSNAAGCSGVAGIHESTGNGVYGRSAQGPAGYFDGAVTVAGTLTVTGDIVLPGGGDCAERFDVATGDSVEPGSLVSLDGDGAVRESDSAYDTKVVGVVAGAGSYRPAIVLDAAESSERVRAKIALFGKVYCKADARDGPIAVGDLLTSSATRGTAMRAADASRTTGAVIGKALQALPHGQGRIPILVTLR
ncbi:MAG: hypothetical protein WAN39_12935 [Candidatus Cybelea sp.]